MNVSRCVRVPLRCCRFSRHNSTTACRGSIANKGVWPHSRSTSASVHCVSTWTDRIKKRWQSGDQSEGTSGVGVEAQETNPNAVDTKPNPSLEQPSKVEDTQVKALKDKLMDVQDKYLRALAESENTRTRLTRQIEEAKKYGTQNFSKDILSVADILDKAIESIKTDDIEPNSPLASLYNGLKLTEAELQKVLIKNGLKKIDAHGVDFDPNIHEALFEVPGDRHGTVTSVSSVGYMLHGRTIRPAKVGVVKTPDS